MPSPLFLEKSHKVSCAPPYFLELSVFISLQDLGYSGFTKIFKAYDQIMCSDGVVPNHLLLVRSERMPLW